MTNQILNVKLLLFVLAIILLSCGIENLSYAQHIYWVDNDTGKIHSSDLDRPNIKDLVTGLSCPQGIALDEAGGKMYWTDWCSDKIQRSNLDGSNIEDLVALELDWTNYIALDVVRGKMYWTGSDSLFSSGTGKIQRASLDGSNIEDLVTGLDTPEGIALDVAGGKIYWVDNDTEKIQRANLNGSNVQDLVTGLRCPEGIALDVAGGKMYWIDWCSDKIQRSNLDGSNIQDIVSLGFDWSRDITLAVADSKLYWTGSDELGEGGTGIIQRSNLDGSNVQNILTGLDDPRGIAISLSAQTLAPTAQTDVNRDGVVDVLDLVYVALHYGWRGQIAADVNGDRLVDIDDLILVASDLDSAPAAPSAGSGIPKEITSAMVNQWLTEAKLMDKKTPNYQRGILRLEQLLAVLTPRESLLLANYPNPFNPETWIPYQLAESAEVTLRIYDMQGQLVRRLAIGYQPAGVYKHRNRAAYWDGRDQLGEPVSSGLYFYSLTAGTFTATRRMVILK